MGKIELTGDVKREEEEKEEKEGRGKESRHGRNLETSTEESEID